MSINWKQKLTSRKLWAALIAIIVTVIVALLKDEIPVEAVDLIGKGVIALCCYIFGESFVDIARTIWIKSTSTDECVQLYTAELDSTMSDKNNIVAIAEDGNADETQEEHMDNKV